jgi:hypothetical protein
MMAKTNFTGLLRYADVDVRVAAEARDGFWKGTITEVAYWSTELPANEIQLLANSKIKGKPLQVQPSNLVAYWPLDDGESGTSANGDIAQDLAGVNNGTCSGGIWREETILNPPPNQPPTASASATPTSGPAPLEVNFTGSGTDSDGTIVSYNWDFGDGNTSLMQNPLHAYNSPGSYVATLTVTDNDDATGTASVNITVKDSTASSQIPPYIRFQARLAGTQGVPLDGSFNITFRLYDTDIGGQPLWEEAQDVYVEEGILDVELGLATELNLPFDRQYWLGVEVESDGEMSPRFKLATVPYAFRSKQ